LMKNTMNINKSFMDGIFFIISPLCVFWSP